jgi:hypothetical protein
VHACYQCGCKVSYQAEFLTCQIAQSIAVISTDMPSEERAVGLAGKAGVLTKRACDGRTNGGGSVYL